MTPPTTDASPDSIATASPSRGPFAIPSPTPSVPPPAIANNAIVAENRHLGDLAWDVTARVSAIGTWVYSRSASILAGDPIRLEVASPARVDLDVYRLGWYRGLGGRLVHSERGVAVERPREIAVDAVTGLAEARGGTTISIPTGSDWTSGIHVAVVRPATAQQHRTRTSASHPVASTTFTIRAASPAPVLFVSAAATWQAYNPWGGASLYGATAANRPAVTAGDRAVTVSFDRPYGQERGLGLMPRWEIDFVRWQEREGRDVDYCVDTDLETHPEVLLGRRLILFVGHHEYWSRPMRAALETAIATGTNVAFLSADEIAWQVRLEASPLGPARRVVCYKSAQIDPAAATTPSLTTCHWRDAPVLDPEAVVVGQMYGHIVRRIADWVVAGSSHWLYHGTGLRDGDRITNLVGQEYDTFYPRLAPPGTMLLANSPVTPVLGKRAEEPQPTDLVPLDGNRHTATVYEAESGATVIAAGTFQWAWALDRWGSREFGGVATPLDERVARITRNLFDRLGDGSGRLA